jgi:hypothetical protein
MDQGERLLWGSRAADGRRRRKGAYECSKVNDTRA